MLGHELRNPLAPICNAVAILKRDDVGQEHLAWCREVIERQVLHLTRLVDDLLDVSRVSRGKVQLSKETLDLAGVVHQAVEICRPLIDSRGHSLELALPAAPVLVEGDGTRLAQVVANLINNAAKYTSEQGCIAVTLETDAGAPGQAVIRVRDNGRGLDPEAIGNLFQLFYQVDRNLDRADGGLGVGLALVRSLVELHGGTVEAASPGRGLGSEFIVRLPRAMRTSPAAPPMATVPREPAASPLRILVVDDNRDAAHSTSRMLEILGHQVVVAHEGRQAIETALRERPEVVLLDIGLPGLTGYEVCRSLRRQGMTGELIVAITGYGQESDRRLATEAGFDAHFVKPVGLAALQQLLAERARKSGCGSNSCGQ